MRLTVKFRTLCLAGVAVVAVLAAGEALARGGGHSGGGAHWIGGGGRGQHWGGGVHGQHWGGGVHGGRVGFGGARRADDFGGYWRRGLGGGGSYWGGYYGGGGVYYDDVGNYGDYAPDGPPAYGGEATIYAPNYFTRRRATRLRPWSIRRRLTLATRQSCPMARIRTSSIFPPRGIAGRARVAIAAWSDETLNAQTWKNDLARSPFARIPPS
jgi:hypothetical protein